MTLRVTRLRQPINSPRPAVLKVVMRMVRVSAGRSVLERSRLKSSTPHNRPMKTPSMPSKMCMNARPMNKAMRLAGVPNR